MSNGALPFSGGVFVADKSAWAVADRPKVRGAWQQALLNDQIATCPIVTLELLYSTQDIDDFLELERELSALRNIPITRSVTAAAIAATRQLAAKAPRLHRLPLPDVLVAAAAQEAGVGVLHYDRHYDRLAEVMEFESHWLAELGTL